MKQVHILLIEARENEIEFFTDALEESGLNFFCRTAKNIEQAFKILNNSIPDITFIDSNIVQAEGTIRLKEIKLLQKKPVVVYSTVTNFKANQPNCETFNYVQIPCNYHKMALIFKNLFINNDA
jgi:DNA-binding NtrC family response regulator